MTCAAILEFFNLYVDTLLTQRYSRIVLKVFDGLQLLIHLPTTERCFSLVQAERGVAMINGKAATLELTLASSFLCRNNKIETTHSDAAQNIAANTNTNTQLHCG
jgi:hypothetical protein